MGWYKERCQGPKHLQGAAKVPLSNALNPKCLDKGPNNPPLDSAREAVVNKKIIKMICRHVDAGTEKGMELTFKS